MALVPAMHHAASVTVRFALVCSSAISTNGSGLARLLSARNSTAHEPQRFALLHYSSPYGIRGLFESMASNDEVMTGPSERDVHTFQRIQ